MGVSATKVLILCIFLFMGIVLPGIIMQPESSQEVWNIKESDFPGNAFDSQERLAFLLNYAILAPSSHNTQPWKFNVSDDRILVFADPSRWLSVADADKREMYLSLGCALENLVLSAEHFGYSYNISYFPGEEDLVAEVSLRADADAKEPLNSTLFEAITSRRTARLPYEAKHLSGDDLDTLQSCRSDADVAVFLSQDTEVIEAFRDLVVEADGALYSDINYKSELGRWLGMGVMGPTGAEAKMAQMEVVFLDVGPEETRKDADLINSTPCIGFICTAENDSLSSIKAGRALERLWLAATSRGISIQPMSQPLEVPEIRERLAGLLPAGQERRVVQQTFRLGYPGSSEEEHSGRRPLDEVLIKN